MLSLACVRVFLVGRAGSWSVISPSSLPGVACWFPTMWLVVKCSQVGKMTRWSLVAFCRAARSASVSSLARSVVARVGCAPKHPSSVRACTEGGCSFGCCPTCCVLSCPSPVRTCSEVGHSFGLSPKPKRFGSIVACAMGGAVPGAGRLLVSVVSRVARSICASGWMVLWIAEGRRVRLSAVSG